MTNDNTTQTTELTNVDNTFICHKCDNSFNKDNEKKWDFNSYCDNCFNLTFTKCYNCEEYVKRNGDYIINNRYYCENCYDDLFITCNQCGDVVYRDDINYNDNDECFCNNCYRSNEDNNDNRFDEIEIEFKKIKSKTFKKIPFKNYCGCEIECINNNLFDNQFNNEDLINYDFSQITDGSLGSDGIEFKSNAFNGDVLIKKVNAFCSELKKRDYSVNSNCGLHIHIQIKKTLENIKKIVMFYKKYEEYFFNLVSKSRQNNQYCLKFNNVIDENTYNKMMECDTIEKFKLLFYSVYNVRSLKHITKEKYNQKRYLWFNLHSIFHRKTLEVRLHNSTIDANKIINWFKINLTLLNLIEKLNINTIKLLPNSEEFFLSLFDDNLKDYMQLRIKKFKGNLNDNEVND